MHYESIPLIPEIDVDRIYTIHYFEYQKDFRFSGESHDFWEFLCVDKGEVEVAAGSAAHILKQNDIIFHEPNEFHNVTANGKSAPNLVVISFGSTSPLMDFFRHKILHVSEQERNLLSIDHPRGPPGLRRPSGQSVSAEAGPKGASAGRLTSAHQTIPGADVSFSVPAPYPVFLLRCSSANRIN